MEMLQTQSAEAVSLCDFSSVLSHNIPIRDVNRLSIIRNSIEKNDYRLRIDVIDNRKLP